MILSGAGVAEVVKDGERGQEHFQRDRHAGPAKRERAEADGEVGRRQAALPRSASLEPAPLALFSSAYFIAPMLMTWTRRLIAAVGLVASIGSSSPTPTTKRAAIPWDRSRRSTSRPTVCGRRAPRRA
jgi:hypothetical protein